MNETVSNSQCRQGRPPAPSRTFLILAVAFVTALTVSNLIAGKLIGVGGFALPAAVVLFPLTYVFGDVFTEVYGFRNAKLVIWLGFAANLFAVGAYCLAVALPHPDFWQSQEAYRTVLGTTPRVLVASLAGYLLGEFSNSIVLSKLKVAMAGRRLWVRTIGSTLVGEALDTVVFIAIAFIGSVPAETLTRMIVLQYLWKVGYEAALTPVTCRVVAWIKRRDGIDVYDRGECYRVV